MIRQFNHRQSNAQFRLVYNENNFDRIFYGKDREDKLLTIAWNRGEAQQVNIDSVLYNFPANTVLCLMASETFHFENPSAIVAWQFDREFYCIVDHDKEVSCAGFLFFGSSEKMLVSLAERNQKQIELLLEIFRDEFETADFIQGEMMLVLLKRLIIIVTRLAREQYIAEKELTGDKLDLVRKYSVLVENHFRKQHQVKFYAEKLYKSPKTLSNVFALYNHKSPVQVIQERILTEAKRLLLYTEKTSKEIAYELGFEDAGHFSKFFKKHSGFVPTDYKRYIPLN
ncbi:helix-turn-helix domain-containing protein [Mucilaginibacter sabulilitoris]|uniref:Helix-turn-helix domain-containing protein n=1 Tax=Mucilaginibacter sabulilitoris TaxID=1173583 RepID=A0ABZ0TPS5_9SPHI|nr:helix-turn-helix domain-containing protein [Mucilaginibacter sabulilitoris]WPU93175.1 helix-turn-helix domain-containing protein [Mucilaginibacter sabulilitoris]